MSLESITERLARGWARTVTPRASRLADEYAVEARVVLAAINQDTAVGDIQAATVRAAWIEQIHRMATIHNRSRADELLLAQLRRGVRDLDAKTAERHATPETMGGRRMSFLGPVGAPMGVLGMLGGVKAWMWLAGAGAALLAFLGLQTARLNHAKSDLREVRGALEDVEGQRDDWKERAGLYAQAVTDAREAAKLDAAALEAERRRQARSAAAERRRQREIQDVLTGGDDAPAWSLRDNEPPVS